MRLNDELAILANEVRARAYAPYSGYAVGVALRAENGQVFTGANVENLSFGLTLCAERAALAQMVSAGVYSWTELVVVTADGGTPCGMCLQSLAEFAVEPDQVLIRVQNAHGDERSFTLKDLLPMGFASNAVRRTEPSP